MPAGSLNSRVSGNGGVIVESDRHVGVLGVVDPGDVLVADALDAVLAEPVVEQGRALERFAGRDLRVGVELLEVVAGGDGSGRTGGQRHAPELVAGPHGRLEDLDHGRAGDRVVPQVVPELVELVEDDEVLAGRSQLLALVEDLLDVRSVPGVSMISPATVLSQSNRSWLIPSGRMATDSHASRWES